MKLSSLKKPLSLLLCAALMFSLLCGAGFAAGAEETTDAPDVPQIRVTTEDGNGTSLQKADGYVSASISITDTDGSTLEDAVQFKVRGNTTAATGVLKKPYTFKFSKKKNVLGLGSGKKWALLANAFDPTLLRNRLAFDIAYELGLEYTSNQRFAELWVDDSYRGCYAVYEPVEEGKDRVNIDIESNGGKQDFLIEYEKSREEEDETYFTVDGNRFIAQEPEDPDEEQLAYITDCMTEVVDALKTRDRAIIEQKIDLESFVKFYLMNDFIKNFDFDMSSVYFYYKNGKLYAGPAWDYDLSTGNEKTNDQVANTRGNLASRTDGIFATKNLYAYLSKCAWFFDEVIAMYDEHMEYFDNIAADGGLLDTLLAQNSDLFARNFDTANGGWRVSKWWMSHVKQPLPTYEENYEFLKNWVAERHAWLKGYYDEHTTKTYLGDADQNSSISIDDVTEVQKVLAEYIENDGSMTPFCDINGDGVVNIYDATAIQRHVAEFDDEYPVGSVIAKHFFA